jgi:hypothetical protein
MSEVDLARVKGRNVERVGRLKAECYERPES